MSTGIIIGASIVLYALGIVWFTFLGLLGGLGALAFPVGLLWPVVLAYTWLRSLSRRRQAVRK